MNYIYDLTLNFNEELYNFYEWNNDDDINFYLKIPIFKVEDDIINDFINSTFIVNKDFLSKIYKKTECYGNEKDSYYMAVFSTVEKALAVSFDKYGESIKKSYLSIDEEDDILEFTKLIKYTIIDYKIKEKNKEHKFITRREKNMKIEALNSLEKMKNNGEYDKLKYIFYEVYNQRENNENKIISKLSSLIECNTEKLNKYKLIIDNLEISKKKA